MAEVEVSPEELEQQALVEEKLAEQQQRSKKARSKKRSKRRKKERTPSQIKEANASFWRNVSRAFGALGNGALFFLIFFFSTALLGGILQLVESKEPAGEGGDGDKDSESGQDVDWALASEALLVASRATFLALKLWSRLIISIIVPTSYKSWLLTKEGLSALQPSLRLSIIYLINAPIQVKAAAAGVVALLVAIGLLRHQIIKHKVVERVQARIKSVNDSVSGTYNAYSDQLRETTELGADILPHVLFIGAAGAIIAAAPKTVIALCNGFAGWAVVIGLPILLSTRALVVYDKAYQRRVKMFLAKRARRPSGLPSPAKRAAGLFQSVFKAIFNKDKEEEEDDGKGEPGMLYVVGSKNILKPGKTLKGVKAMGYPAAMDRDIMSSVQQYKELHDVLSWLRYWTVIAVPLIMEQLPISGHILRVLPMWAPARTFMALWLQIPGTQGAHLAFEAVIPLVSYYWGKIIVAAPSENKSNMVLNQMVYFLPIPETYKNYLFEILSTGGVFVLVALPIFILPAVFVSIGATIVGLVRPVYSGIAALLALESAANEAIAKHDGDTLKRTRQRRSIQRVLADVEVPSNLTVAGSSLECTQWLEYWVVYTVFMLAHGFLTLFFFWFPFWFHLQLAATLWLQLPFYRGSRTVFKTLLDVFYQIELYFIDEDEPGYKKRMFTRKRSVHVHKSLDEDSENEEVVERMPRLVSLAVTDNNPVRKLTDGIESDSTDDDESVGSIVGIDDDEVAVAKSTVQEDSQEQQQEDDQEEKVEEKPVETSLFSGFNFFGSTPSAEKEIEVEEKEPEEEEELEVPVKSGGFFSLFASSPKKEEEVEIEPVQEEEVIEEEQLKEEVIQEQEETTQEQETEQEETIVEETAVEPEQPKAGFSLSWLLGGGSQQQAIEPVEEEVEPAVEVVEEPVATGGFFGFFK